MMDPQHYKCHHVPLPTPAAYRPFRLPPHHTFPVILSCPFHALLSCLYLPREPLARIISNSNSPSRTSFGKHGGRKVQSTAKRRPTPAETGGSTELQRAPKAARSRRTDFQTGRRKHQEEQGNSLAQA